MTQQPSSDFIFKKTIRINYSDLDFKGRLKTISILNFLQDSACIHASQLGISGFELAAENFAWVISKYRIKVVKSPQWNDEVVIKTWRIPCKNLYEFRYFNIRNKTGINLINASGIWVMIKKENCRPVRLSRFMTDSMFTVNYNKSDLPSDLPFDTPDDIQSLKLKCPEKIHCKLPFKVRMHDLDLNRHVNNAVYVEWAAETVPLEFTELYRPEQIDVSFHKASFYGDNILSETEIIKEQASPVTLHSITTDKNNGKTELARVNIIWAR